MRNLSTASPCSIPKVWEAHEAWEEIWMNHPEDGRFYPGLIQLAPRIINSGGKSIAA
jgi:hypothetical protein